MASVVIRHGAPGPAAPLGPRPGWQEDDPYGVLTKAPPNTAEPPPAGYGNGRAALADGYASGRGTRACGYADEREGLPGGHADGHAAPADGYAGDRGARVDGYAGGRGARTDGYVDERGAPADGRVVPADGRHSGILAGSASAAARHASGRGGALVAGGPRVGLSGALITDRMVTRAGRRPVGLRVAVALMELAVVAYVVVRLAVAAFATPVGGTEATTIARAVARARGGGGQGGSSFEGVVAGWLSASGALGRHAGAAAAAREVVLVAAAVTVLLVWILAGRLRLTAPARVVALLVLAGTPAAAQLLAGQVRAGALAAVFVAFAAVLVAGEHAGILPRLVALGALAIGLVLAPVVLPAVLVTVAALLWQGSVGIGLPGPARRGMAGLLVLMAATAFVAIWIVDLGGLLDTAPAALPVPTPGEWVLIVITGLLTLVALTDRWLRAPATGLLVLLVTAAVAPAGARLNALMAALPVAAVVATGCADDLAAGVLRSRRRSGFTARNEPAAGPAAHDEGPAGLAARDGRSAGPAPDVGRSVGSAEYKRKSSKVAASLALLMVGLVGVGGVATYRGRPADLPVAAVAPVAAWIRDQLPAGTPVSVDDAVAPDLIRAGLPAAQVRTGAAWRVSAEAPVSFVAAFGDGNRRLWITGPLPLSTGSGLGPQLADNSHLSLTDEAAAALRGGLVDDRVLLVLADLAGQHTFGIAGFPVVAGESPGNPPLRQVRITSVDGRPTGDAGAFDLVQHWLDEQLNPYRPAAVVRSADGVLVRYPLVAEGHR